MKSLRVFFIFALILFSSSFLTAQSAPLCDGGGVCGPNPSDPSYGGIVSSRPQKQNARGTSSPVIASWEGPLVVRRPIGSQSYNKAIPILSLPGRGLDLNLTLYYNSRIWTLDTATNAISLNADRDFPSYGFRLDFGYLENDSANAEMILTESDGTKHPLRLTGGSLYDSNDGTFIEYNSASKVLSYKNGTMVTYEPFPSASTLFRPIQIMDTNRNFITIRYVATVPGVDNDQHIDTITDTLGRVIHFNYNAQNQLTSITQAVSTSTDPSGTHIWATFTWSQIALTYNFSGLTVVSTPANGTATPVLAGCTYPNQTGYKFSYGAWGIVNRIDLMAAPVAPSPAASRSYESYNFPDTSVALNDAPAYTTQTMSPDGSSTSIWQFSISETGPGQVTGETIQDPLGTVTTITLNGDGTLNTTKITDTSSRFFLQKNYTWTAVGSSTMISSVATTDDAGNVATVSYGYDTYGNVTDLKEHSFNGLLVRETVTSYWGAPFTSQHILNLPQTIQVKDGSGLVHAQTDFAYDTVTRAANGITTLVQNDGNTTASRGNLTSITRYSDPGNPSSGITRTYTYDILGNLIIAHLDCCNQKAFNYDPATQYAYLSSTVRGPQTGPQFTTTFAFNPDNGLITRSTDENNQATTYVYDNMYRVASVTNPLSVTQTIGYDDTDAAPQVTNTTTANKTELVKKYDGLGHLTEQDTVDTSTGGTVSTTKFQYDAIWRQIKKSNPYAGSEPLVWTTTGYDPLNRVTSITPPSGGGTFFTFSGNTVLIQDPANKQRKNYFDALGRLVQVDEPGWGDAFASGDSVSITGNDRFKETHTRVCVQWDPRGNCIQWELDTSTFYDTGNVTITVNGRGYSYTYGQNDIDCTTVASGLAGQINADPARVVNAGASSCTVNLSAVTAGAAGNSITVSSSSGTTDSADFGAGTTSFPATTTTPTLTGGENAVSQQNAVITATRHLTTTYGYDVFDNVVAVSEGAMGPINGQQLAGQSRSYSYDPLDRLTSANTPESGTLTTFYTKSDGTPCAGDPSLVCRVLDARGVTKNLTYDGINRISGITYTNDPAGTPAVNYYYDQGAYGLDRLSSVSDGTNSETFTYDNLGRIGSVSYSIDGTNYPVQYAYNDANEMTSLTYPSGRIVKPDYDTVGRLNHIKDAAGTAYLSINSLDYSGAGELKKLTYGNGVIGQFGYNDHLQLSTLRYYNPTAPAGTADVLNLSYDYTSATQANNNGQIQAIHYFTTPGVEDQTKSESFTYDAWTRLAQAQTLNQTSSGTWNLQWAYDRLGNRLSQGGTGNGVTIGQPNFTIDAGTNRIVGYCYDAAGNLTDEGGCPAQGSPHRYGYDGTNRLISVNNGTATASYTYMGPLRIKKVAGGTTTAYIYSGSKPIAEYVSGQLSKEYIYSGSRLVASVAGSAVTYHHPDHLSNRAETDAAGNVTRTFGSFPYGETWYETGTPDKWKFTSYARDNLTGETGLDYADFRYYAPGQGSFMSADLLAGNIGDPQSLNRYSYVVNDPINLVDPLGLSGQCKLTFDKKTGHYVCHVVEVDDGGASGGGGGATGCGGPCGGSPGNGGGARGPDISHPSKKCLIGLKMAGTNTQALQRAVANWGTIEKAATANGIVPSMLAAIGIRETGFRNIAQSGGGQGRGIFQIDLGQNPSVTSAQADDPSFAANFAAQMLASNMTALSTDHPNLTGDKLVQATAASYNFGTGNISGNPNTIDVGTTGNNYGTDILLLMECF